MTTAASRTFTFYIEGLNVERSAAAPSEKQARYDIWMSMTDAERDATVEMDCIDEVAA